MSVQVAWAEPYDASPDSEARRRRDTVETLGLAVLNRRLDRLAHSADPPFVSAASARSNVIKSAKLTTLEVSTAPGAWRRGLQATVEEQRRAVQYGVSQDELDREITEYRTTLTTLAAGGATRRTPSVADEFASSVNNQEVFTSPAQDLAIFERDVRGLTAAEVNDALRKAFAGSGPLVYVSSPTAIDGGEPAVSAAFAQAEAQPVSPPVVEAAKTWPYSHFGAPGRVVGRREVADLGVTFVRFANNVRLTVKPTQFRKDQILVDVRIGDGRLGLPKDRPTVAWAANVLIQGGTKQLSYEDIERVLASKLATAQVSVGDDAFDLSGKTRPADLDTQLQLLTAYTVDPGFRPEAFLRSKSALPNVLDQIDSTPTLMLAVRLGLLTHEGDQRWTLLPTREQLAASQPADVQRLLSGPLASGPIDVVVTGDVTVERAIQAVAATFGALPARPAAAAPAPGATQVRFPGPNAQPLVLLDRGRPDQAVAMTAWPTSDFFSDPARARALTVAEQVFASRLLDQVRVAEGATYSPATTEQASHIFPGYGFMLAEVETPPAKIPGFFADVSKIVADMRAKPPTPDEMERAKKPTVEKLLKAQQTNEYWLGALERAQRDPRELDAIRTSVSGLQAITAADVQRVSHAYLLDPRTYRVIVRSPTPAPGAPNETPIPAPSTTPAVPTLPARPGATPTAPGARTPPPGPTAPGPATPAAQPTPPGASSGGR
jgi:zinc protease